MKKLLKMGMSLALACTVLSACSNENESEDQLSQILEKGVMVVGTEGTYSPNSYHDEDGNLVGFDVEVARTIGEHLGVDVEFFEAEWDSLFAAMDSGRVDTVINEVEYSEERAEKYDFYLSRCPGWWCPAQARGVRWRQLPDRGNNCRRRAGRRHGSSPLPCWGRSCRPAGRSGCSSGAPPHRQRSGMPYTAGLPAPVPSGPSTP